MIDIQKLKDKLNTTQVQRADNRRKRLDAGLAAEPPASFVEPEHARVLIDNIRPLYVALTEYLELTNKALAIVPFDVSRFERFEDDLLLIKESTDMNHTIYAEMLRKCIDTIADAEADEVSVHHVISELYRCLKLADNSLKRDKRQAVYKCKDIDEIIEDYRTYYKDYIEKDRRLSSELSKD